MSKDLKKKNNKLQVVVDILKKNNLITETIALGDTKFMVIKLFIFYRDCTINLYLTFLYIYEIFD